jgi:hypothetical protein
MTLDKLIGPATLVYLASATVAALWWASNLTTRVAVLERSTVTAERIARLETQAAALADTTRELKTSVNELVHELRAEAAK